ncbi:MAG: hypothetical protein ACRCS8_02080 [Brevinema sp.]
MTDIKIDAQNEIVINEFGDFDLVEGKESKLQLIRERLLTPIQSLFYDKNFGSEIMNFIQNPLNDELEISIITSLQQDEHIDPNSIEVTLNESLSELRIEIEFTFLGEEESQNIVLNIGG